MKRRSVHARGLILALALGSLVTGVALAQTPPPPDQGGSGTIPGVPGIQMPSPLPQPTISGTPMPYPAYGSPAPDVEQLTPKKGVPQSISLADAIRISVALSPAFALQNAEWAAIHAKYTSSVQAYYPGVSVNAQAGNQYSNGTTSRRRAPRRARPRLRPARYRACLRLGVALGVFAGDGDERVGDDYGHAADL